MLLEMLNQIFTDVVLVLISILSTYLIRFITGKMKEAIANTDSVMQQKYLTMLQDTVTSCVIATNQTYVNAMKNKNAFDKAAQLTALQMTRDAVMAALNEDAREYLENATSDFQTYLNTLIEANVHMYREDIISTETMSDRNPEETMLDRNI